MKVFHTETAKGSYRQGRFSAGKAQITRASTGGTWKIEGTTAAGEPRTTPLRRRPAAPQGLVDWLNSDEARRFEGKWVALGDDWTVRAAAASPGDLPAAAAEAGENTIVFVTPTDMVITG